MYSILNGLHVCAIPIYFSHNQTEIKNKQNKVGG